MARRATWLPMCPAPMKPIVVMTLNIRLSACRGQPSCDNAPLMTADDFRTLALSFDGAVEQAHMGHPDFRANGRIFATLQADDERGMVKVPPDEQLQLLRVAEQTFPPASGAWGRQGCTMVRLAGADVA